MQLSLGFLTLTIDLSGVPISNPVEFALWLLAHGGWVVAILVLLPTAWAAWLQSRQHKYEHGLDYMLLAVDVPKETEQSPRAVEQIFAALAGTHSKGNVYERLWLGKIQETFSFEIVSLGGYIQFLVRTARNYRDLVEASIYAQYPNAEITEVEDYVGRISGDFDTDAYDLWGTEFVFTNKNVYPIRLYSEFEHELSQEFKDPMAQLLEVMGRIGGDEDIWLQLVVTPIDDQWKHEAKHEIEKIIKGHAKARHGIFHYLVVELPMFVVRELVDAVLHGLQIIGGPEGEDERAKQERTMQHLTPGERSIIEAIQRKTSKLGFRVKFRLVYWGSRDTFLKGRGVSAVVGAIHQFTALDLNGFKPSSLVTTKADYFLKESRINKKQKSVLRSYKRRSAHRGAGHGIILNIEELASLYHFPVVTVKAPLVKKTETKKAEPPFALPSPLGRPKQVGERVTQAKGGAPGNIPFVD